MDKVERVMAVVEGRRPDRPPVSFWCHFDADQRCGSAAVRTHLDYLRKYDLDFLKVMNDNGYPLTRPIRNIEELESLEVLRGDEPEFERQLDLLAELSKELRGRTLMATTVFNAWATLRKLIKPKPTPGPPKLSGWEGEADRLLRGFMSEDRAVVARAVATVGETLANFSRRCLEAGADGIFLSVRDDWMDEPDRTAETYDEIVRPSDLKILDAVSGADFNLLHVCGVSADFAAFAKYPVQVINWADRAAGPSIESVIGSTAPAVCGGVDNLEAMPNGKPRDCAEQVCDALRQAADRPILIGPGCTYDPNTVPDKNLHAIVDAARNA